MARTLRRVSVEVQLRGLTNWRNPDVGEMAHVSEGSEIRRSSEKELVKENRQEEERRETTRSMERCESKAKRETRSAGVKLNETMARESIGVR